MTSKSEENCPNMLQKTPKRQTNVAFGAVQKHTEKKDQKSSKEGQKYVKRGLNLTSRENGKRSFESADKMLVCAAIFRIY